MRYQDHHVYVVGDFFAKYWAERVPASGVGEPEEYKLHTYDHRVDRAAYVWDPEIPERTESNYMQPEKLDEVVIHFREDPTGYGKPFRDTVYDPIVADIRLEGVVKERKRSYGTLRGRFFAKVHTSTDEADPADLRA